MPTSGTPVVIATSAPESTTASAALVSAPPTSGAPASIATSVSESVTAWLASASLDSSSGESPPLVSFSPVSNIVASAPGRVPASDARLARELFEPHAARKGAAMLQRVKTAERNVWFMHATTRIGCPAGSDWLIATTTHSRLLCAMDTPLSHPGRGGAFARRVPHIGRASAAAANRSIVHVPAVDRPKRSSDHAQRQAT